MIYKRQKFLLAILLESPADLSKIELTGAAAIICKDSPLFNGQPPYDFLKSTKPISLQLNKDIEFLATKELINISEETIDNDISAESKQLAFELSFEELKSIKQVISSYGLLSFEEKIDEVKKICPDLFSKPTKRSQTPKIFTVGYEGESVDHFFQKILNSGIEAIIDIRSNPISRKYGFSKKIMSQICDSLGLEYIHYPQLGIHSSLRKNLKSNIDYKLLLDEYEKSVLKETSDHQKEVISLLKRKPSTLLCFEADENCCHRSRLANHLAAKTELQVRHL